jgi:ketosteroid isomerase-like protein
MNARTLFLPATALGLLALGVSPVVAGAQQVPPPPSGEAWVDANTVDAETNAELDAANQAFSAAYLRSDSAALADAYTEDAVLHPPAGGVLVGRARIGRYWAPVRTSRSGHRIEPMLRRDLGDGHVLEVGRWHSRTRSESGAEGPWLWGCYTVVWKRGADEVWRMHFDGWSAPHEEEWACRPRS